MRALVVGYFNTVGDIEVLQQVELQLQAASVDYDVGTYSTKIWKSVEGWVDVRQVNPSAYTHLFVVCGPFNKVHLERRGIDLDRFLHCTRIGINLTMIEKLSDHNPFDVLLGRDSDQWHWPDLSFRQRPVKVPVAGLCLVDRQSEYGSRQMHQKASDLLRRLAQRANLARVELDTHWPRHRNASGLSSPEQFESICARLDVMLTTRLHGMVLALKNGVPAIALDPIAGGGKVSLQSRAVSWPEAFTVDEATDKMLDNALIRCLTPAARERALACSAAANNAVSDFPEKFTAALKEAPSGKSIAVVATPISRSAPGQLLHRLAVALRRIYGKN